VQVFQNEYDLGSLELGPVLVEAFIVLDVLEEFPTRTLIHHHLEFVLILERLLQLYDERVVVLLHYLFFKVGVHFVFVLLDEIFSNGLHRIQFIIDFAMY